MSEVKLSIVIPSRNGALRLPKLISDISKCISEEQKKQVEVVISDNFSNPSIDLPTDKRFDLVVKIVRPENPLATAEENLLFALKNSSGIFSWILGDDDCPLLDGVSLMFSLIENGKFDLMVFNSLAQDPATGAWDITRLQMDRYLNVMSFTDFVKRAGFWSVTSGFSTLVIRKSMFNFDFMEKLHSQGCKIYSHVSTLIFSYSEKNFVAVNMPIVKYNSNSFDDEEVAAKSKDRHWVEYAILESEFYRNPWTVSFLKQIEFLQVAGKFKFTYLLDVIDQAHLGNRFFIFDSILAFLIDQLIYQELQSETRKMTENEVKYVLTCMYGLDTKFDEIIDKIQDSLMEKCSVSSLTSLRERLSSAEEQVSRRFLFKLGGGSVYRSVYGFLWTPFKLDLNLNLRSMTCPYGCIVASTLEDLESKIIEFKKSNPFYLDTHIANNVNLQGLNSTIIKLDKLSRVIPKFIRRLIK